MTTVVIMPGGFHPFHAGHLALYNSARRTFPDAEVYVAATNDTSKRPFPFAVKEKLAKLAGVEPGHFVQVKSPFRAEEITNKYDPEKDVVIFVRSEKDEGKPPIPGGVKKDGTPQKLQPLLGATKLEPFSQRVYMAYLPTVPFAGGKTSASEIRAEWPTLDVQGKLDRVASLYPRTQGNPKLAATVVKMLDTAIGGVTEGRVIPVNFNNRQQQAAALKAQQDREWAEYQKLDLAHEANLKRLAAWWWNNDESPAIEKKLERMGLEIGRDEGYDDGGAFIVASGDTNGDTYLSWPAEELENLKEGVGKDLAKLGGMSALAIGAGLAGHYADQQHPKVEVGGQQAFLIKNPGWGRVPDTAMILKGKDGKTYKVWSPSRNNRTLYATPVDDVKEGVAEADKHSMLGKIQRGHELKKKVDSTWKDIGTAQKAGDKAAGSRAFRKHERYANLERPGTWTKVDEQGVAEGKHRMHPDIEEFLDGLSPDDVGVEEFGPYRVHYEGFTDDCQTSSDYCENPEAVYQQVYNDFIKRENGAKPIDSGMVGDENYPILYSIFKVSKNQKIDTPERAYQVAYYNKKPWPPGSIEEKLIRSDSQLSSLYDRYILKKKVKQGVAEGEVIKTPTGLRHKATDKYGAGNDEPHHYTGGRSGFSDPVKYARDLEHVNKPLVRDLDASMGITWKNHSTDGVAEAAPPSWAGGMGGIRPPAGGTTATPPGIRPPSGPPASSQPTGPDFVAPHGDAKQEFEMFKAGTKPAVIVRGSMTSAYQPLLKTGRYPMKQYTSQGETNYVIGQPGEDDRVEKIYQLVSTASKMGEQGNFSAYNNSNYHRWLGTLLGYPRDKVEAFVNNYFRNKQDLAQQRVDVKEAGEDFNLVDEFAKIVETCYWGAVKGYDMTDWISDKIITDWYRAIRASRNPVLKKVYRSIEDAVDAGPERQQEILGSAIKALRGPDYKPQPPKPLTPQQQAWVDQFFGGFAGALASRGMRLRSDQSKPDVDENQGWAATLEDNTVGYIQETDPDYIEEKWSEKYKRSINCANPRGFSQRAHCAGRKK